MYKRALEIVPTMGGDLRISSGSACNCRVGHSGLQICSKKDDKRREVFQAPIAVMVSTLGLPLDSGPDVKASGYLEVAIETGKARRFRRYLRWSVEIDYNAAGTRTGNS